METASVVCMQGHMLSAAAATLLRIATAAGLDALEHENMQAVMVAAAGHCHCPHSVPSSRYATCVFCVSLHLVCRSCGQHPVPPRQHTLFATAQDTAVIRSRLKRTFTRTQ
jgi:hypothetical protein